MKPLSPHQLKALRGCAQYGPTSTWFMGYSTARSLLKRGYLRALGMGTHGPTTVEITTAGRRVLEEGQNGRDGGARE